MRVSTIAMLFPVLLAAPTARALPWQQQGDGVPANIRYYESVAMMSSAEAADQGTVAGVNTMDVSFYTLGREFDLKLEMHAPFAPGAKVRWVDDAGVVEEAPPAGVFFRGRVEGDPHSWVRLTLRDGALGGVVSTDDELYFLEPASRFFGAEAAGETLAYRLSDTDTSEMLTSCAARHRVPRRYRNAAQARPAHRALREMLGEAAARIAAANGTALRKAQIGMVGDFEYFSVHGGNSATDLAEVVNNVDGIYQAELGVTVEVGATTIFTTDQDPFSSTTVPLTLLQEFAAWRDANDDDPSQPMWNTDLSHLFT